MGGQKSKPEPQKSKPEPQVRPRPSIAEQRSHNALGDWFLPPALDPELFQPRASGSTGGSSMYGRSDAFASERHQSPGIRQPELTVHQETSIAEQRSYNAPADRFHRPAFLGPKFESTRQPELPVHQETVFATFSTPRTHPSARQDSGSWTALSTNEHAVRLRKSTSPSLYEEEWSYRTSWTKRSTYSTTTSSTTKSQVTLPKSSTSTSKTSTYKEPEARCHSTTQTPSEKTTKAVPQPIPSCSYFFKAIEDEDDDAFGEDDEYDESGRNVNDDEFVSEVDSDESSLHCEQYDEEYDYVSQDEDDEYVSQDEDNDFSCYGDESMVCHAGGKDDDDMRLADLDEMLTVGERMGGEDMRELEFDLHCLAENER